jgi:hypothetical protein
MEGTTTALGADIHLLRPTCPQSVSRGGDICWFLLDKARDHRPGGSRGHLGQFAH